MGEEFISRFTAVSDDPLPSALLDTLGFAFSGALLQAGMGLLDPAEMSDRFDAVVALAVRGAGDGAA